MDEGSYCERDCDCGCDYHGHCLHYYDDEGGRCCYCEANVRGEED